MKKIDENRFKKIAEEIQAEWEMGGLSSSIYYDFAKEIAQRYIIHNSSEDNYVMYVCIKCNTHYHLHEKEEALSCCS